MIVDFPAKRHHHEQQCSVRPQDAMNLLEAAPEPAHVLKRVQRHHSPHAGVGERQFLHVGDQVHSRTGRISRPTNSLLGNKPRRLISSSCSSTWNEPISTMGAGRSMVSMTARVTPQKLGHGCFLQCRNSLGQTVVTAGRHWCQSEPSSWSDCFHCCASSHEVNRGGRLRNESLPSP